MPIISNLSIFPIFEIIKTLSIIIPVLIGVAYLTLAERKFLGYSQNRKGPNVVGFYGLLQPLADGAKLFLKETIIPNHVSLFIYLFSPILALIVALIVWCVLPLGNNSVLTDCSLSVLFFLSLNSIGVYAILMSGWGSNSKYAFLGSLRAAAQMISYEVALGLILISLILSTSSLNFLLWTKIQKYQGILLFPLALFAFMYLVCCVAETNRAPFDLTEGESELVSGLNVEYPGMTFALFFLAEYAHIIFTGFLFSAIFLGGNSEFFSWAISLSIKSCLIILFFIWLRTSFPRFRYDQLMHLVWKSFLPLTLSGIILVACLIC